MHDREHLDSIRGDAIDDAIRMLRDFAHVVLLVFRHAATAERLAIERFGARDYPFDHSHGVRRGVRRDIGQDLAKA